MVRSLPGGELLLKPMRGLIQVVQFLRSRNTPHARLPRIFKFARRLTDVGEYAFAAEDYGKVLAVDPLHVESRWRLGEAYEHLGQPEQARDQWRTLLENPHLDELFRRRTHESLARVFVRLGNLDEAEHHALRARGAAGRDSPDRFEALSDVLNHLAEDAIVFCSDFTKAEAIYRRRDDVCRQYESWLSGGPEQTLFLTEDWVRNIGHIACLDFWAKMQRLGWLDRKRIVVHAPPERIANRDLLYRFEPFLQLSSGHGTKHLSLALGRRVASMIRTPGEPGRYFLEAIGCIQQEWERQGRAPLLRLSEDDRDFGEAQLRKLGVPPGAWFVSLHVRSPGFKAETALPYSTYRDASIETYQPLIEEITCRGGWVIRLGDPAMPPLPPRLGVIDYAHSPLKSERLDLYLCAACRFYAGGASGLSHVPAAFGTPCLVTNWISNALPVFGSRDLFTCKRIWCGPLGRELSFDEWMNPEVRARFVIGTAMAEAGLDVIDNTPEELREAAIEMLERLETDVPEDDRQREFAGIARRNGLAGFPRIGRHFLRRHPHLLPENRLKKAA